MAGNSEQPDSASAAEDKLVTAQDEKPTKPRSKTFSCTNCGGNVTIRNPGQTFSAVCEQCLTLMDTSTPAYRILTKFYEGAKRTPLLELGSRGKLFGREWEVIGFVVRRDVHWGVIWEEYLLFNPYYGYRWLLQNNGHWNFTTPLKDKPVHSQYLDYNGKHFKLYYNGKAEIDFVLGEFYWKVKTGDAVDMSDFINPPQMLSSESTEREKTWSLSQYVEASEVKQSFKPTESFPDRKGIHPNQPSQVAKDSKAITIWWVVFIFILTGIQVIYLGANKTETLFNQTYIYTPNLKEKSITTPVFDVKKNRSVELKFTADVDNFWFYYAGELVNDKTDESYPFDDTIEYYHGYSDGESWSEGSTISTKIFTRLPEGKYYVNIDAESGAAPRDSSPRSFSLEAQRDPPNVGFYLFALFMVSFIPPLYWFAAYNYEVSRWSDSDYSPYRSSDD